MQRAGCDDASVKELYLLAQLGESGMWEANGCIAKIMKKFSNGRTLDNPSGYLHHNVMQVRHNLEKERWYGSSRGNGGSWYGSGR